MLAFVPFCSGLGQPRSSLSPFLCGSLVERESLRWYLAERGGVHRLRVSPSACASSSPDHTNPQSFEQNGRGESVSENGPRSDLKLEEEDEGDEPAAVQGPQPVTGLAIEHLGELEQGLIQSTFEGNVKTVMELLDKGASITAVDRNRRSALHFAAANGLKSVCERLISSGADVNLQDIMGLTPLHMATGYRNVVTLELLLDRGADPHIENLAGELPFDIAEKLLEVTPKKKLFVKNPGWEVMNQIYNILDKATEDEEEGEEEQEVRSVEKSPLSSPVQASFVIRRRQSRTAPEKPTLISASDIQVTVRVKKKA